MTFKCELRQSLFHHMLIQLVLRWGILKNDIEPSFKSKEAASLLFSLFSQSSSFSSFEESPFLLKVWPWEIYRTRHYYLVPIRRHVPISRHTPQGHGPIKIHYKSICNRNMRKLLESRVPLEVLQIYFNLSQYRTRLIFSQMYRV